MADKEKSNPKTDAMRAIREARYDEAHSKPVKSVKAPVKAKRTKPALTRQTSVSSETTSTEKP